MAGLTSNQDDSVRLLVKVLVTAADSIRWGADLLMRELEETPINLPCYCEAQDYSQYADPVKRRALCERERYTDCEERPACCRPQFSGSVVRNDRRDEEYPTYQTA